jgi:pimeloyl-ACP methyl ester carboxylesterase
VPAAGHWPHLEEPEHVLQLINAHLDDWERPLPSDSEPR